MLSLFSVARFAPALVVLVMAPAWAGGADTDGDGVPDNLDNCSAVSNPDQRDTDADGFGNICDADLNNDGIINLDDLGLMRAVFFTFDADADFDGDGLVNLDDLSVMRVSFFGAPGPGAVAVAVSYADDVQPILGQKCAPCHTGLGVGGHNIGTTYADALSAADGRAECVGLNLAECSLLLIQAGQMPAGAGCTGDPVLDAGNASCLTQTEQDTIQGWINMGFAP